MSLDPGTRLGSFEILAPLGAGGMGEVYRASDHRLGREVAIKILPEAFAQDPSRLARFEREARLLASVNHPGLAAIYGIEQDGPVRYIVMELVPGETLAEKLATGALPLKESLAIGRQIAEALEAAHERGIIHRDLKPSNVKVTPDGKVKVLDLGLAKAMDPKLEASDASKSPTMVLDQTRPGVILGTAEFMSPEQARGKSTDKRTDIWALGCVLFEMLSGRRAFAGETVSDILAAILTAEPDWNALPAATPRPVRDLIHRCLEKDVNQRLRDVGDARIEIEGILSGTREETPLRGRRAADRRRRVVAAVVVAIALAAAALVVLLRPRHESSPAPLAGALIVLPSRDLSGSPGGQLIGDGLVETLSVRLGQLPGVQVVTPTAAVAASDSQTDPFRAARSVGAGVAVRSSFMRSGDRVRITYSVWNVDTRTQIASGTIDGPASDLFGIQDRLAERVAAGLNRSAPLIRTPKQLETASQQERFLQAIGNLQRFDRAASVDEAIRLLEGLAGEAPDAALVQAALGRAYLARQALTQERLWADRALASAERARSLDPTQADVDVTLGETFLLTGQRDRAEEAFRRALATRPADAEALVGLGSAREQAKDFPGAEASYRKAIELQPYTFGPYNRLGSFYYARARYSDAADVFRRLTRVTPDSYRAFSNLGGSLTMMCAFDDAGTAYRRALELKPDDAVSQSNLGMNQLWRGRYAEAVASLERAGKSTPDDYQVWANLGDAYRAAGDPAKAAEAFGKSIPLATEQLRLNPKDAAAHSFLATDYAKLGKRREAEEHRRQALELGGENPDIFMDAAVVSVLAGRNAEAVEFVRKSVRAGYCPAIAAGLPELASLRSDSEFRAIVAAPRKAAGF